MAGVHDSQKTIATGEQGERVRHALDMTHELLVSACGIVSSAREDGRDQFTALVAAEQLTKMAVRYLDVGYQTLFNEPGFGTFEDEFAFLQGFRPKP